MPRYLLLTLLPALFSCVSPMAIGQPDPPLVAGSTHSRR